LTFLPGLLSDEQTASFKVNRHKNHQLPGFCIYHDHAMHVTLYNVVKGLAGMYLIYNKTA